MIKYQFDCLHLLYVTYMTNYEFWCKNLGVNYMIELNKKFRNTILKVDFSVLMNTRIY